MKKILILLLLLVAALSLMAQPRTLPRTYVQKLVLESGQNPNITFDGEKSAPEYTLKAWITERPKDILSTDKHGLNSISIKEIGDDVKFPRTAVVNVQLGNFQSQWKAGETLKLELKHKKSKQKMTWEVLIPEGTNLIKFMDEPLVIPPFAKKKK